MCRRHLKSHFPLCPRAEPAAAPPRVSAESLSASEIEVSWGAVPWKLSSGRLLGYEVSPGKARQLLPGCCHIRLCAFDSDLSAQVRLLLKLPQHLGLYEHLWVLLLTQQAEWK